MVQAIQFSSFKEFFDMGGYAFNVWSVYLIFAIFIGGGYFIWTSILLAIKKTKSAAMKNFFGSFVQLGLLLILIIIDGVVV